MKKTGIEIGKSHKLSKDGKSLVPNEKRFDLCKQLNRAAKPKLKFKKAAKAVDAFRV